MPATAIGVLLRISGAKPRAILLQTCTVDQMTSSVPKHPRTLRGRKVKVLREIRNVGGEVLEPGDIAVVKRHHRNGNLDLYRPAAWINNVDSSSVQAVSDDE